MRVKGATKKPSWTGGSKVETDSTWSLAGLLTPWSLTLIWIEREIQTKEIPFNYNVLRFCVLICMSDWCCGIIRNCFSTFGRRTNERKPAKQPNRPWWMHEIERTKHNNSRLMLRINICWFYPHIYASWCWCGVDLHIHTTTSIIINQAI